MSELEELKTEHSETIRRTERDSCEARQRSEVLQAKAIAELEAKLAAAVEEGESSKRTLEAAIMENRSGEDSKRALVAQKEDFIRELQASLQKLTDDLTQKEEHFKTETDRLSEELGKQIEILS